MTLRNCLLASAMVFTLSAGLTPAGAVTLTGDYGAWLTGAGGSAFPTTTYAPSATPADFSTIVTVSNVTLVGGGSFTTNIPVEVDQVGTSWGTWSGGYTGHVLWSGYDSASSSGIDTIELALTGLYAFGLEIEPNAFSTLSISVLLNTSESLAQDINGDGGAKFFGYYGNGVTGLTITAPTGQSFAFGNFRSVPVVPLPAAFPLFAGAIAAFGAFGHWRHRRSRRAEARLP